jgi:hypothetical protein
MVEVRLKSQANVPGEPLARGLGSTKKIAEQDAARRALEHLEFAHLELAHPELTSDAATDNATASESGGAEPDRVEKEPAAQ